MRQRLVTSKFYSVIVTLLLVLSSCSLVAKSESRPGFFDIGEATAAIEQALAQGVRDTTLELKMLGPDVAQALKDVSDGKDFSYGQFSARTSLEMLYRRAELHAPGQGEIFLARLRSRLAQKSAAVAEDPRIKFLDNPAINLQKQIAFAPLAAMTDQVMKAPLSPATEEALEVLSEYTSNTGIGHIKKSILRNLRLNKGNDANESKRIFDNTVLNSKTRREVLKTLVLTHLPPPKVQEALRKILTDFATSSAAFAVDPAAARVIQGLSTELTEVEKRLVSEVPGSIATRYKVSLADGAQAKMVAPKELSELIDRTPQVDFALSDLPFPSWEPPKKVLLTKKHQNYVERSFEPRNPLMKVPSLTPTGTLMSNLVPRSYRVAIRSSRAARGIAVGAEFVNNIPRKPVGAYWISDPASDQFGRIIISFSPCLEDWLKSLWTLFGQCDGDPLASVSMRLYSDSFLAANQLLWGNHSEETAFVDGEITVLMSLDPNLIHEKLEYDLLPFLQPLVEQRKRILDSNKQVIDGYKVAVNDMEEIYKVHGRPQNVSEESFMLWASGLSPQAQTKLERAIRRLEELSPSIERVEESLKILATQKSSLSKAKIAEISERVFLRNDMPRGIVFHPALHGRHLAWSAARVDFWINDTEQLFKDAGEIAGDMETAVTMKNNFVRSVIGAGTWQYYETGSVVELNETLTPIAINVRSDANFDRQTDPESRFSITIFEGTADELGGPEVDLRILPSEEIRKPLDWLQRNHPDFRRLRDFSTALTLLRYLKSHDVKLTAFSMDDQSSDIATPEWIFGATVEPVVNPLKPN